MRARYVSVAVGEAGRSLASLAEIPGQAERNNRRHQLSGAIARHDGCFLQGAEEAHAMLERAAARLRPAA